MTRFTVLVPVHDQAAFLGRALASLRDQGVTEWEAVVLDDGSADDPHAAAAPFLRDRRLNLVRWSENRGLGATLNAGLALTSAPLVAYLPADDHWDPDHLAALLAALDDPGLALAWSGVRHHEGRSALGPVPGHGLQLVQVAHRRTPERWVERAELEADDLGRLLFNRLAPGGGTGQVTCSWTDHPGQRHKAMRETFDGGLNVFRTRYRVAQPLRFLSSDSGLVDEVARYAGFRDQEITPSPDGLRILIVGELAFNPERVMALVERGHRLHGLWTRNGLGDATVGPLPFGHVTDLACQDTDGWRQEIAALAPDVIWAQLNWRAVPLALAVRRAFPDLPVVWHFKESPQRSILRGEWPQLAELFLTADASLVATPEEREWVLDMLSGRLSGDRIGVLDGDLPSAHWLTGEPSPLLSAYDGEPHTVVVGRPLGFDAEFVTELTRAGVHLHLYGQVAAPGPKGTWTRWWTQAEAAAGGRLHLHPAVGPEQWVRELSRYDAGWLHRVSSTNCGDLRRATWDDLNTPARLPVMLAAGLPVLVPDATGHRVAVSRITAEQGTGLSYRSADDVAALLADPPRVHAARESAWSIRHQHTFDAHVDRLLTLFHDVRR